MSIELIAIGDELLDGRTPETNSLRLARRLREKGRRLACVQVVPDDLPRIIEALTRTANRGCERLVVCGGLGITVDDLTREALASWLGRPLVVDPEGARQVAVKIEARQRRWREEHAGHARRPEGTRALENPVGVAVGVAFEHEGMQVMVLPGVPAEFDAMVDAHLIPALEGVEGEWAQTQLAFFGLGERELEARVDALGLPEEVAIGLTAGDGVVGLVLNTRGSARARLEDARVRVREALEAHCVGEGPHARALNATVGALLRSRGETLAIAESCTGGLIAHLVSDVAGCSSYFLEGVVTYSNEAKMQRLGVKAETLEAFGAVGRHTVLEMVSGVRATSGATWGIATSGIAGPGGGRAGKPVGTVHVAVEGPGVTIHRLLFYPGRSRSLIKKLTAYGALGLLIAALEGREPWPQGPLPEDLERD